MATDERGAGRLWHRDLYAAAVWSSDLKPLHRLVALAYADHARDSDTAWVSYERLMQRTGLGRTALASAMRVLVAAQWLVVVEPARQHRSARYRLATPQQFASRTTDPDQESASRTSEPSQQSASRTTGDASSSPRGASSSPDGASSSPREPDCSSDHKTDHTTPARAEAKVLIDPQDRAAAAGDDESLAGRLRAHGVDWTDRDVAEAVSRMARLFGGDLRAEGDAAGALLKLATRRNRIERLGAYLARLTDDQVLDLRVSEPAARRPAAEPVVRGCDACTADATTPPGFLGEDTEGRYLPCPTCRPHLVRQVA